MNDNILSDDFLMLFATGDMSKAMDLYIKECQDKRKLKRAIIVRADYIRAKSGNYVNPERKQVEINKCLVSFENIIDIGFTDAIRIKNMAINSKVVIAKRNKTKAHPTKFKGIIGKLLKVADKKGRVKLGDVVDIIDSYF